MKRVNELTCLCVAVVASSAMGDLLTSNTLEAPLVIDFSQFPKQTFVDAGIQIGDLVGEDVFVTAIGDHRVGPMNHGLGENGLWFRSGMLNNDFVNGVATIAFNDGPVSGVGALSNYAPGFGDYTITALGAAGEVLESYNIVQDAPINTPGGVDAGEFRGIQRASNDIYAYQVAYAFNVMDDLAFSRVEEGCFADCDGNGALNILDFVCYQGLFQSGDPSADCDDNGALNILDFVCFQGAFQKGCD